MRVLVADDHSLFRDGIVSLLEAADFQVIDQVGDGRQAVEVTLGTKPDLVLMDITMPVMNGIEALTQIKAHLPSTQVVMLTVSDDDEDLIEAIEAGADGYLLKNLKGQEFLDLLIGLRRGEAAMTLSTTAQLLHGLAARSSRGVTPVETLTEREIELLRLVANGLSNKALAQELSISENTVKYHMKNILQKLQVQNRTEAVTKAIRSGMISPEKTTSSD